MKVQANTWPYPASTPEQTAPERHVWLRLLETTDVHAHLLPFDYDRGAEVGAYGFARTATLIERARAEAANTLLFDNGDFMQGSVLSDLATGPGSGWTAPHPVIMAMNAMGYDAVALGNHEFNFGLEWLSRVLEQANFPVVCANAMPIGKPGTTAREASLFRRSILIPCALTDSTGQSQSLTIGVLGLLPPQITTWDHLHLHGRITTRGIVETAREEVPRLRAAGADLVVALAHSGIVHSPGTDAAQNIPDAEQEHAALALGDVPGIDAILAGHSHQVFPGRLACPGIDGVDPERGALGGVPAVLAGYRGSHLGVIDLCLASGEKGWSVRDFRSATRPVRPDRASAPVPAHPRIVTLVGPAHDATLRLTTQPVTISARPLHSYLAQLVPCATLAPVLATQAAALKAALADTPDADTPVLAATAPFKTGGHAGPDFYVDIPAGPLSLGNVAELYPFPNTLIGVRATGAEVIDWLERAASCFHRIAAGEAEPQPVWNPDFSGHAFDTISGLDYTIDLSHPPRFDTRGALLDPAAQRIRDVRFNGAPLDPEAEFVIASNNFRAFGGGPYPEIPPDRLLHEGHRKIGELLTEFLRANGPLEPSATPRGWRLTGPPDATLLLETGPGLLGHPGDIAAISGRSLGTCQSGFTRLAVPLDTLARLANPPGKS